MFLDFAFPGVKYSDAPGVASSENPASWASDLSPARSRIRTNTGVDLNCTDDFIKPVPLPGLFPA